MDRKDIERLRTLAAHQAELAASERLFMASAVMETAPDRVPMMNFAANKIALHTMPTKPDSRPAAARVLGSVGDAPLGKNAFMRNFIINLPLFWYCLKFFRTLLPVEFQILLSVPVKNPIPKAGGWLFPGDSVK